MVTPAHARPERHTSYKRGLLVVALVAVAAYLILPQVTGLGNSWQAVRQAKLDWFLVAASGLVLTYLVAAAIYVSLSMNRLPYWRTVTLQMASMFAGRILPAGVGALGINYLYLRKQKHTAAQAGAVVATNNSLGFIGNLILVAVLLVTTGAALPSWHLQRLAPWLALAVSGLLLGIAAAYNTKPVRRIGSGIMSIGRALTIYRRQPRQLLLGLLLSIALTATYALILSASARSIGPHLSFGAAVIVMTIGVAGATVTPTPGGIGGAEAALAAALALYHIPATDAVAIAVLYRLVTYWLGLLLGGLALIVAQRRHYI